MKRLFLFTLLILPLSLPAQDLVEFQNGQVADADDMNANFSSLKEAIDALSIEAGAPQPNSAFFVIQKGA